MNKNDFKSLSSYSKEEVKEAIMAQVNWLAAIGFSVKRAESLQFRCSSEGKTIIFNDRKVILEGIDLDNITIDLMFHGSDKFRKILAAFEVLKKYQGLPIDEVELYGYRKPIEPEFSMNKSRINNLAEFKNEVVEAHPFTDMVKSDNDTLNINTLVTKVLEDIQKYNPDATMQEISQKIHEAVLGKDEPEIPKGMEKAYNPDTNSIVIIPKSKIVAGTPEYDEAMQKYAEEYANRFFHDGLVNDEIVKEIKVYLIKKDVENNIRQPEIIVEKEIEPGIVEVVELPKEQDIFVNSTGKITPSTTTEHYSEIVANRGIEKPVSCTEDHFCQHCKKRPSTQIYNNMLLCGKCYTDAINLV